MAIVPMIDAVNPNAWTSLELLTIGVVLSFFLACLTAATWQAFSPRNHRWARMYWVACSVLMWTGVAGLIYFAVFPPEHFDEAGRVVGEIPPEFGFAGAIVTFAFCAALAGFVMKALMRVYRRTRQPG